MTADGEKELLRSGMKKSSSPMLTDKQKAALRPFVRKAEWLEQNGFLRSDYGEAPSIHLSVEEFLALIYEFEKFV